MTNIVYRKIRRLNQDLVERFRKLDVASVHEASGDDLLMDPTIRPLLEGVVVAGPAVTARNTPGDNLALHVALDLARPGDVLVMTTGAIPQNAIWGENATIFAQARGLAGVVCDGAIRDVATVRAAGFPVWGSVVFARRSSKNQPVEVNVPIACGGLRVDPGDIVVADDDGVVVVRYADAERVLIAAEKKKASELERQPLLHAGKSIYSVLGLDRELQRMGTQIVDAEYELAE